MRPLEFGTSITDCAFRLQSVPILLLVLLLSACGSADSDEGSPLVFASSTPRGPHAARFGTLLVGGPANELAIPVRNTSEEAITVEVGEPPAPFRRVGPEVLAIAPKSTVSIALSFAPQAEGIFEGEVLLRSQGGKPLRVELEGKGVSARLTCTETLDFGLQPSRGEIVREATCTNDTEVRLAVRPQALHGADAAHFEVLVPSARKLAPGESTQVPVRFYPDSMGKRTAALDVRVVDTPVITTISLQGEGTRNALAVERSCQQGGIQVGRVAPGGEERGVVKLRNLVQAPIVVEELRLLGEDEGQFRVLTETPLVIGVDDPSTARREDEVQVEIEYAPLSPGAHSVRLVVVLDPIEMAVETCLHGASGTVGLECSGASVDFGSVAVGMSRTETLRCTHVGEGIPLQVRNAATTDSSLDLLVINDDGSHGSPAVGYAPGEGFDLQLTWTPTAAGPLDATALLDTDAGETSMAAAGAALALAPCDYQVVPEILGFGIVPPGEQRRQDVRIRNDGTTACILRDLWVEGGVNADAFAVEPIDELILAAGDELRIPVHFTPPPGGDPDQAEFFAAALRFQVSHPQAPLHQLALRGWSRQHCVQLGSGQIDLGPVTPGCQSRARTIELTNTCEREVVIEHIDVSVGGLCTGPCAFEIERPALPSPLTHLELPITYRPQAVGRDVGAAWIYLEGDPAPLMVTLLGHGTSAEHASETLTRREPAPVDLLLVIDDMSSGPSIQAAFGSNVSSFLAYAREEGIDFQIGVTTTGNGPADPRGRLVPIPPTEEPRVLHSKMPDLDDLLASRLQVGGSGWIEAGLEAARQALTLRYMEDAPSTDEPADGNLGLVRDDASLSILVVTGEGDQSGGQASDFITYFQSVRRPDEVRVHGIIPHTTFGCGQFNGRYLEVVQATGGHWEPICTTDWAATLTEIGRHAFRFPEREARYVLTGVPGCEGSCTDADLQVRVDGMPVPQESQGERVWRYVTTGNAIEFTSAFGPPKGSQVEITYPLECIPAD